MFKNTSFKIKLMLLTLLSIIGSVMIFSVILYHYGNVATETTIEEKMTNAQSIQQEFLSSQAKQLELISLLVSSEPAFVTYVTEAINYYKKQNQTQFLTSIADLLLERTQQYDFDIAIITDADGMEMARSNQIISVIKDLSTKKPLKKAIQELQAVTGYWLEDEQLFQTAIVPIAQGQNLVGFLITGYKIDNIYLNTLSQLSGTEIFVIINDGESSYLNATSADVALTKFFENIIQQGKLALNTNKTNKPLNLNVNRQKYVANIHELTQINSTKTAYLLSTVSRYKLLAPFIQTRVVLVISAIVMTFISFVLSFFTLRAFFQDLKYINTKVNAIRRNKNTKSTNINNPELSSLSGNLNQLSSEIIGRSSLAKHLVEVSKKIPTVSDYFWVASENEVIKPNQIIGGRFKILRKIGSGGMGMVFQAIDTELNELIALKVLKKTEHQTLQVSQLKDEIKFSRRIQNPNVVRIHDFGKIGGHVFISMEYIMGYTIAEVLNFSKKLRPEAAKYTAMQICKGLEAAHTEGIIHRDLKPENLIIELDNTVKLMDFGIASAQNHISKTQQSEMIEGTIAYSSPEQLQGKGADERSDIYALGTIIMEMYCGKKPYASKNDEELMLMKVSENPALITDFWENAPILLEHIITKCLMIDPKSRYQNVSEVLSDLQELE